MLIALEIENFAIIDELHLEFQQELNVLTGETGAGKSIIIDAVNLLLGGRASADFIRSGASRSVVAGIFESNDNIDKLMTAIGVKPEEDNNLLLQREISHNGRNICRVNGRQVTLSMYRLLGSKLVDIYGQHEHHSLMLTEQHLEIIDLLAGSAIIAEKNKLAKVFEQLISVQVKISQLTEDQQENLQKLDLWNFQLNEIKAADFKVNEEEELRKDKKILASLEKIESGARGAYEILNGAGKNNVRDLLVEATAFLGKIKEFDEQLLPWQGVLESCLYQIEDIADSLRTYTDELVFDPDRLEGIESRLALISSFKRKYGSSIKEILEFAETLAEKISEIENADEVLVKLEEEYKRLEEEYLILANSLTITRKETALKLEKQVVQELSDLEMANTKFTVNFSQVPTPTRIGSDQVEFMLSSNPGEPLKPLNKIASGGELSRIMLALKNILAGVDDVPTLIFDEIDTGIGGRAIQAVAEKLAQIGKRRQVICVTHSPQIAGHGSNHFHLFKELINGRVTTQVQVLTKSQRIEEIARMLTGNKISAITLQQAKEILQK